ncbi:NAD(P)H:quinone oxidoreductase type IV [Lagierella sp.]|uniref:NAD(P)H:quinone oxidoreductase type IV n=1 Tax=Lagierella sp. TaxID=2849657 RepID=UPI0026397BAB|nr:NAD(P)H:quinone oxidoreductase type IV [Lagierella sp.]
MKSKLTIVFYSMTGTNLQMARWAEEEAKRLGAEVRLRQVQELIPQEVIDGNPGMKKVYEEKKDIPVATGDDIIWADAILFSTPTRFGAISSQMKQFMDTLGGIWAQGKTTNKMVSAMSSANNPHGGQENTVLNVYSVMYHLGAIVVAPGFTSDDVRVAGGNPYGTTATMGEDGKIVENVQPAVAHQVKRLLEVTEKFIG